MTRFFRKIRQGLLAQNRFTRYLIYALGEIILVVIGILIALSINNWNQERISRTKSEELLRGMTKDLSQDITTLDRMIFHYESRMGFFERHIHKTDFSDTPIDTLIKFFDGGAGSFNVTAQSFEKVKNLGISQLCSNDSLSDRIGNYYTRTLEFTQTIVKYDQDETVKDNDFWRNEPLGIEIDYKVDLDFPVIQDSLERKKNLLAFITSPRCRNHIRLEVLRKELVLEHHRGIRKTAEEMRKDIEDYLTQ